MRISLPEEWTHSTRGRRVCVCVGVCLNAWMCVCVCVMCLDRTAQQIHPWRECNKLREEPARQMVRANGKGRWVKVQRSWGILYQLTEGTVSQNCQASTQTNVRASCVWDVTPCDWSWLHPALLPLGVPVILFFYFIFMLGYRGVWVMIDKKKPSSCLLCFRMWWLQTKAVFWFLFLSHLFPAYELLCWYTAFSNPKGWI